MKEKTIFKKRNISLLYVYFLLGENSSKIENFTTANIFESWFSEIKTKEEAIKKEVISSFKNGWNLEKIPVIEKTIIFISSYEIFYLKKEKKEAIRLINKVVEFSKSYLDVDKFKYINATLDSITKKRFSL